MRTLFIKPIAQDLTNLMRLKLSFPTIKDQVRFSSPLNSGGGVEERRGWMAGIGEEWLHRSSKVRPTQH